jgi:hypothetical protein
MAAPEDPSPEVFEAEEEEAEAMEALSVPEASEADAAEAAEALGTSDARLVVSNACKEACDRAYGRASARCRRVRIPRARAICWAAAAAVYATCLARCR